MGDFATHQEKDASPPLSLLGDLTDYRLRRALEQAGLRQQDNLDQKVELFIAAATELAKNRGVEPRGGPAEAAAFWVPGRVEVWAFSFSFHGKYRYAAKDSIALYCSNFLIVRELGPISARWQASTPTTLVVSRC